MVLLLVALLGLTTVCASAASGTNTITLYVDLSAITDPTAFTVQTFQEAWTYAVSTSVSTTDAVEIVRKAMRL